MAEGRRRRSSKDTIPVDFSKVEEGGGSIRVPEGDYRVRIKEVSQGRSKSSDNPMLTWHFEFMEGKAKGRTIIDRTVLIPNSLWKLRDLLEAVGIDVPKRTVNLPLKKLVGKELGITVTDGEPYEGRTKSEVQDYIDLDTLAGGTDDDEEDEGDFEDEEDEDEDTDEEEDDDEDADDEPEDLEELDLDSI